jgi:hypothetical protein
VGVNEGGGVAYKVKFDNLGAKKVSWEGGLREQFPDLDEIIALAKEHGHLLSREVDVSYESGSPATGVWKGTVWGGMQKVGEFQILTR